MKFKEILSIYIILKLGMSSLSETIYNFRIRNKQNKVRIICNHPILYVKNKGEHVK